AERPPLGVQLPPLQLANSSRRVLWNTATSRSPVVTVHDVLPITRALIPWYRLLAYPLLRRASVTIVHSGFAADLLRHLSSRQRRVEVIPHPAATFASLDRQHARRSLGWEGDAPLFVIPRGLKGSDLWS